MFHETNLGGDIIYITLEKGLRAFLFAICISIKIRTCMHEDEY